MKRGKLLVLPAMGWLGLFFALPLLIVVVVSFASRTAYGQVVFHWTLENYIQFLEPLYLKIFVFTLGTAFLTTLLTFAMGYPVAYTIAMILPRKWQQAGIILVMIPFWINFLIRSYSWVIILRAHGLINSFLMSIGAIQVPLSLLYNNTAVLIGMVYGLLPFMVLPIYVPLEQMDKRLLEAASDLGAPPLTAFRKITLPLTLPGVAAGSILVFISSLGMFVVPDIMGGAKSSLMGNVIQNQFLSARDWPFGSALSIILALLSLIMIVLYYKALQAQKGGHHHEEKLA